jgi:hypothetical protein
MSPACERNAGTETPILAQRTVVRMGIRGTRSHTKTGSVPLDTNDATGTCAGGCQMLILGLICLKGW